jgi:hypothetical protein
MTRNQPYEPLCQHALRVPLCCDQCGFGFGLCADCPDQPCPECGAQLAACLHTSYVHA